MKVASLAWGGLRMNIVDTPGHADFGADCCWGWWWCW